MRLDHVLVPIDFSESSLDALATAAELAPEATLHALHVLSAIPAASPEMVWGAAEEDRRVRHTKDALTQELRRRDLLQRCEIHVAGPTIGNPAAAIADQAGALGIDLVVLPSHGRTGLTRLALGSVAERVVRLAPCPVLVLRASA